MDKLDGISNYEDIKEKVIKFLREKNKLDLYKKIEIIKISEDVYGVKSQTGNIAFFVDRKGEYLLGTADIIKSLGEEKYKEYLRRLGYKEVKDSKGIYHMYKIDKEGKIIYEVPQDSYEYYRIFEILSFIDDRLSIYKDNKGAVEDYKIFMRYGDDVYKEIADIIEDKIKEEGFIEMKIKNRSISPLELYSYISLGQVEGKDIIRYIKEVFNERYLRGYYDRDWWKYIDNKKFYIVIGEGKWRYDGERIIFERYNAYEIDLKPSVKNIGLILKKIIPIVEEIELRYTRGEEEKMRVRRRYEEMREYLKKKLKELNIKNETKIKLKMIKIYDYQ